MKVNLGYYVVTESKMDSTVLATIDLAFKGYDK